MILSLVRFPPDGLVFEHLYRPGELDPGLSDLILTSDPVVKGRVDRVGLNFRLRGSLQCTIERPCDRCLDEVSLPLDIDFDLLYAPAEDLAKDFKERTAEVELGEQDLDLSTFQHDQIDLDALVIEQIELQVPIRFLCREECRGLCPQCGADWNTEQCSCHPPVDPRWESLTGLGPAGFPETDLPEGGRNRKGKRQA